MNKPTIFDVCDTPVYAEGARRMVERLKWELRQSSYSNGSIQKLCRSIKAVTKGRFHKTLGRIEKQFMDNRRVDLYSGRIEISRSVCGVYTHWTDLHWVEELRLFEYNEAVCGVSPQGYVTHHIKDESIRPNRFTSRFAPHAFERFFERLKGKTMRHLFYDVTAAMSLFDAHRIASPIECEDGVYDIYAVSCFGVWLGSIVDGFPLFKTFVSDNLLREDQNTWSTKLVRDIYIAFNAAEDWKSEGPKLIGEDSTCEFSGQTAQLHQKYEHLDPLVRFAKLAELQCADLLED